MGYTASPKPPGLKNDKMSQCSYKRLSRAIQTPTIKKKTTSKLSSIISHQTRKKAGHRALSDFDFFTGISKNNELGKDFLREMDTPICTSNTIFLPLGLDRLSSGRCIVLSPFGHLSILGCYCEHCAKPYDNPSHDYSLSPCQPYARPINPYSSETEDLCSLSLTFFNNADKVIQNKTFYLSLLSHSMDRVRNSFNQPGLLYTFIVLRTFCPDSFPVFVENGNKCLTMFVVFKARLLHISEECLRLLSSNLQAYSVSIDCSQKAYIVKVSPVLPEEKTVILAEDSICEAVASLDYSDELKQEFKHSTGIVSNLCKGGL
ncbi:nuclear egress lamina protein [Common bottlenose dolphin gammaherpesvirus 1 strain Sarasota]|uniref:Nuclear egress lamina protein n=1 Tax=Common bottlenose dolphin gammaherpesvirus 1 strain Sarasota TaxID=2022783 RepID=A0A1Z1NEH8_9GAMA|nr:nuclear egress lamina protein [Common bottlenose dolphin gammaherpesvirus 1 strain Sarasota]ARW78132.1 nuclear egress lamina protein [Common bottlenose dolphin gammaherpesvirus 1 strain Sarasota]